MPGTVPRWYLLTATLLGVALLCGVATAGILTYTIDNTVDRRDWYFRNVYCIPALV